MEFKKLKIPLKTHFLGLLLMISEFSTPLGLYLTVQHLRLPLAIKSALLKLHYHHYFYEVTKTLSSIRLGRDFTPSQTFSTIHPSFFSLKGRTLPVLRNTT